MSNRGELPIMIICALFAACGGDGSHGAGSNGTGASTGTGGTSASSSSSTGGAGGDGDDDFDHARTVQIGDLIGESGALGAPGDHDYFTFHADTSMWLRFWTSGNPWNDPARINTVLRLFDASHTQIAENDDNIAPFGLDAEILTRLPAPGTYFIEVLEHSDFIGEPPRGSPDFVYGLAASPVDPTKSGVVIDPEQGDGAATAAPTLVDIPTAEYDYGEILGGFDHALDVDVYSFAIGEQGFVDELLLLPGGAAGNGSTAPLGLFWVTDNLAATIHARIDGAKGLRALSFVGLDQGLIWIERPAGPPGANDFYAAKVLSRPPEHAYEVEDPLAPGANDTSAGAEPLAFDSSGGPRVARWFTRVSTATDVDQYAFDAPAGANWTLRVASRAVGSGVLSLHVQVLSDSNAVLAESIEAPTAPIELTAILAAAGTIRVRFDKAGQDPEVESDYADSTLTVVP